MLYFAYGSNLYSPEMKERCPDSKPAYRALLPGFRAAFTRMSEEWAGGVLDIQLGHGEAVWGMVYEISELDLEKLNTSEGYHCPGKRNSYNQIKVTVLKEGVPDNPIHGVLAYQVAEPSENHIQPSQEYLLRIIAGAVQWGLPFEYRLRLESFIPIASSSTALGMNPQPARPVRIGVLFGELGKLNTAALKYLILHLNTLQTSLEFELLPADKEDPLIQRTRSHEEIDVEYLKAELVKFKNRTRAFLSELIAKYPLSEKELPAGLILLTTAKISGNFYAKSELGVSVLALGHWQSEMAPPSLLEAFITLILRQAVGVISRSMNLSRHLGSRACLFDYTPYLDETRFKTLHGFICNSCRAVLGAEGYDQLAEDVSRASDTSQWLGKSEDPTSPAGIVAKLGYDLFLTRGVTPTWWDNARTLLRDEGTKEFIKFVFAVLLAALLFWLGWKK